jgi:hypothetical protein
MAQTISIADTGHYGRQDVLAARAVVRTGTGYDTVTQTTETCLAIPAGAIVVGGHIYCSDATSGSVTVTIGDGGSAARYLSATSVASTGRTALVPTGYAYTADDTIDMTFAGANPAADGVIELVVLYIIDGRSAFVQK